MAGENDQTRWIGIRPTNPPETIPVSMAAAPPCTKVEPCAANNPFNTITKKLAPAISDLQAIEAIISYYYWGDAGGTGTILKPTIAVPGGKLWIVNHAIMLNDSGLLSKARMIIKDVDDEMVINARLTMVEGDTLGLTGHIVMQPTEYWRFAFYGVPDAGHQLVCTLRGYQVSQYT